jgi:hypothetical protein
VSEWLGRPVSPTLDRTIAFVVERMPAAATEIEAELRSQGLTSGLFRLEGVIKAAELLGRRLPFSITEVKGERLVHARDIPSLDTIVRIARRVISRWRMATISNVVAEVRKVESGACDRKNILKYIRMGTTLSGSTRTIIYVMWSRISVNQCPVPGKLVMECIIETKAATILEFIQATRQLMGNPCATDRHSLWVWSTVFHQLDMPVRSPNRTCLSARTH